MASLRGSAKGNWFQAGKVLGLFAEHSEPDLNDVIMMSLVPISNLWRQILCFMPLTTRCLILFMRLRMWFDRALRKPAWQNCLVSFRHSLTMLYFCHTCHHEISMIINQIDTAVRLFVEICKKILYNTGWSPATFSLSVKRTNPRNNIFQLVWGNFNKQITWITLTSFTRRFLMIRKIT